VSRHQQAQTSPPVEQIAAYAFAAQPERLTNDTRRLFKRNILDSLGCAIAALPGQPFRPCANSSGSTGLRAGAR
jgi:2-methylcitrate dehydratase